MITKSKVVTRSQHWLGTLVDIGPRPATDRRRGPGRSVRFVRRAKLLGDRAAGAVGGLSPARGLRQPLIDMVVDHGFTVVGAVGSPRIQFVDRIAGPGRWVGLLFGQALIQRCPLALLAL